VLFSRLKNILINQISYKNFYKIFYKIFSLIFEDMNYNQEQLQREILSFQNQLNNTYSTFGSQQQQQQNYQQNNNSNTFIPRNSNYNNYNNTSEKDVEYRDTINEKVNNLKFSLPSQGTAKHFFDDSFINNNPQYYNINGESNSNNINNNISRKDSRDGMNNKMDDLKFQRFENQDIPSSIRVRENERSFQDPQSFFNYSQTQNNQQNNQKNNQQNISNRFSNKDLNNERMQSLSTLPRALHQPMKMINEQPAYVSFKSSFEDQYKSYTQNQSNPRFETNNNNQQNYNNNNNQQQQFLPDENLLRRNESSRENYKDSHNKRLSELSPLARTCAIPTTDYTQSIQQNTQMLNQNRNSRINDIENRKEAADIKTKEWRSISSHININNPIHNPVQTPKLIIQTDRPIDTRQTF